MGSQGTQGKLHSFTAKKHSVALVAPDILSSGKARPSTAEVEHDSVLIRGDFRDVTPPRHPARRTYIAGGKIKLFGHFVPVQFLLLALVEMLVFAGTSAAALHYLGSDSLGASVVLPALTRVATVALVMTLSLGALGLYSAHQRAAMAGVLSRTFIAFAVGLVGLEVLYQFLPSLGLGQNVLATALLASLVTLGLIRPLFYRYVDGSLLVRRVLVLGSGERAKSIEGLRRKSDQRGFKLFGFVNSDPAGKVEVAPEKVVVVGHKVCEYALKNKIDEIVVALDDRRQGSVPTDELLNCRMSGIDVTDILDFFERETAKIRLDLLRPSWLVHADGFKRNIIRDFSKRLFDIALSTVLFTVTSPLMLFTAVAIYIESGGKGSVFYRQQRVGQDGKLFDLIKFRSMRMDAEKDGKARWAEKNDPRITRVGNFIRKYRLDELPQLWNVLRNDMSIVGPRPERPEFVAHLSRLNPLYKERHRVKPGIAGWAQLRYPYGASEHDSIEKLQYDLYYVKNHRIVFDLYILVQTVEVVLYTKGAR